MFVYSSKIIQFITEIKQVAKLILTKEVGLRVERERFYDRSGTSYPLLFIIYNHAKKLGYFDPNFYELGFHECLMHASKLQLHNIIRHELAHYMTFIKHGASLQPHGAEFRAFCDRMNWGEEVFRATICLEGADEDQISSTSEILRKIQKVMALQSSSNPHEAELAMLKSQELLLKHNIDVNAIATDEEKMVLKRIFAQKKIDAKVTAISKILETFFVSCVFKRGASLTTLEILGTSENVEIAEYVAGVLDTEMDRLWNKAQRTASLQGQIAKNSFFHGLAKGYCNKIEKLKKGYGSATHSALMVIEKKLITAKEMVYPRLRTTKSRRMHSADAASLGQQMGKNLNINPAISKATQTGLYLR
jgi:uncharacterized protein DUF2786/SprT-like family protein